MMYYFFYILKFCVFIFMAMTPLLLVFLYALYVITLLTEAVGVK